MILLRQLFRAFDVVREDWTPNRLAAGFFLGAALGLFPVGTPQWFACLCLAAVFRVQAVSLALAALTFWLAIPLVDPHLDRLGHWVLTREALRPWWRTLFHAPLIPYTQFFNSTIMGVQVAAAVLFPPAIWALGYLLGRFWGPLTTRVVYTFVWSNWQAGRIARAYREWQQDEANLARRIAGPLPLPRAGKRAGLRRYVRFGALRWIAVAVVCLPVVLWLTGEMLIKRKLETIASQVNGAKVTIGSLRVFPFDGEIRVAEVQITDPANPLRNLFTLAQAKAKIEPRPLLRRKFIFRDVDVVGVSFHTERSESGALPESELHAGVAAFLERSASGYYMDVRNALRSNPLKYLGALSSGLNLNPRVDQLKTHLVTLKMLEKQEHEIETLSSRWESGRLQLPNNDWLAQMYGRLKAVSAETNQAKAKSDLEVIRSQIARSIAGATDVAASFTESLGGVQREIASLEDTLTTDVSLVKEELKLPDLSAADLSPRLFGGPILDTLERLTYFVDLARRKMPKGDKRDLNSLLFKPTGRGTEIHFANVSGSAGVIVPEIRFVEAPGKSEGLVGVWHGLTSEPSFFGHPMSGELRFHFPDQGVENVSFKVLADHTTGDYLDEVRVKMDAAPLRSLALHQSGNTTLRIERASLAGTLTARWVENRLKADWNAQLDGVQYQVSSRFAAEESILKTLVVPVQTIAITGSASGPGDNLSLEVKSNFGRILSEGLRREFRHSLLAIDDNIRRSVLDRADPTRRAINSRVAQLRQGALQTVSRSLKSLQDLAGQADTLRERLDRPKLNKRAARRPR